MSVKKPLREIPFTQIERDFQLAPLRLGLAVYPAVSRNPVGGYSIRVWAGETRRHDHHEVCDYFQLAEDGEVLSAPRGYAKDYRPGRVTGLAQAVADYAVGGGVT